MNPTTLRALQDELCTDGMLKEALLKEMAKFLRRDVADLPGAAGRLARGVGFKPGVGGFLGLKHLNPAELSQFEQQVGDTVRTRFEDPAIEAGRRLLSTSVGGRGLPPGIQQGIGGSLAGMIRHPDEAALDFAGIAAPMLGHAPPALMRQSGATGAIGDPTEAWRYLKYRAREGLKSWEQT